MSKKCWFVIALVFALAATLAIAIPALWPPTPGVTYANFSRIETGMTRERVEALLGKPNVQPDKWIDLIGFARGVKVGDQVGPWLNWQSEADDQVSIQFDEQGRVVATMWNFWRDDRTAWEKLRDRLPWIGRRPPAMVININ